MILHVFTQVSDYGNEFLRMLADWFNPADHFIVFRSSLKADQIPATGLNIKFLDTRHKLLSEMPVLLRNSERLIFHSFPVSRSLLFWYRFRKHMPETIWSVWGQDAYWYKYARKNFENRLYEWIRTQLIKKVNAIFCPMYGDFEYIRAHYPTKAAYIRGMYPIPTDFKALAELRKENAPGHTVRIQVGNSATPTNNTEEVLEFLGKHAKENLEVYVPLSYGDPKYAARIEAIGKRMLGEHFIPVKTFLDRQAYAKFVSSMDVLIMNHQRQQGLGNIFSYLYLGKKVYIRSDNPSYRFFSENGIRVYDTQELIEKNNLDTLHDPDDKTSAHNMNKTESLVAMETIASGWSKILNKTIAIDHD